MYIAFLALLLGAPEGASQPAFRTTEEECPAAFAFTFDGRSDRLNGNIGQAARAASIILKDGYNRGGWIKIYPVSDGSRRSAAISLVKSRKARIGRRLRREAIPSWRIRFAETRDASTGGDNEWTVTMGNSSEHWHNVLPPRAFC